MSKLAHILVCGGGLAGWMTATALDVQLPPSIKITLIDSPQTQTHDIFYGTVLPPTAYQFFLSIGLSEPIFLKQTHSSFSYGTHYLNWGRVAKNWVQCHQLPLPVDAGVPLIDLITEFEALTLEDYLITAQAARQGRFIHPPTDASHPMSRAEYGYQYLPAELLALFKSKPRSDRFTVHTDTVSDIARTDQHVSALTLASGMTITADFLIDAQSQIEPRLNAPQPRKGRKIMVMETSQPAATLGPALRQIKCNAEGWQSLTSLRGQNHLLSLSSPQTRITIEQNPAPELTLATEPLPWRGNCVQIGQAACALEPLTPAPMIMLQRDIERLISLIPLSQDMQVEAREYNQGFQADAEYAGMFNQAFYVGVSGYDSEFWQDAQSVPVGDKLSRKLAQFEGRGLHVDYDLEPFDALDWGILHHGLGRRPARKNKLIRSENTETRIAALGVLKSHIAQALPSLPPHSIYMDKLLAYLARTQ